MLLSAIRNPPIGAGPESVTVPVELAGPITEEGLKVKAITVGGFTVSVAAIDTVPSFAVILGVNTLPTGLVVTAKVAELTPAGIVTLAGTVAES